MANPELGSNRNPYEAMFKRVNLKDFVKAFHNSTLKLMGSRFSFSSYKIEKLQMMSTICLKFLEIYLFFIFQTSFAGSSRSRLLPLGQWHFFKVFLEFIFTWRLQNQLFGCCFRFISSSQVVGFLGYGQSGLQGLLAWTRLGIIFIQINLIWIDVNPLF